MQRSSWHHLKCIHLVEWVLLDLLVSLQTTIRYSTWKSQNFIFIWCGWWIPTAGSPLDSIRRGKTLFHKLKFHRKVEQKSNGIVDSTTFLHVGRQKHIHMCTHLLILGNLIHNIVLINKILLQFAYKFRFTLCRDYSRSN